MLKQLKRCGFRSKSLPRAIPLLVHKFINTRGRFIRRNAIKAHASGPLETPTTISRRKSCEGDEFGYFKSSKEWMQLVKIDNPQDCIFETKTWKFTKSIKAHSFFKIVQKNHTEKYNKSFYYYTKLIYRTKTKTQKLMEYKILNQASKTKQICYVFYQHLNQKQQFNKLILSTNPRKLICLFYHLLRLKFIQNYSLSINQLELKQIILLLFQYLIVKILNFPQIIEIIILSLFSNLSILIIYYLQRFQQNYYSFDQIQSLILLLLNFNDEFRMSFKYLAKLLLRLSVNKLKNNYVDFNDCFFCYYQYKFQIKNLIDNINYTIDQPLFPKKMHRNWSQLEIVSPQKAITQPTSNYVSPRKFKKSIMNIYGISNTMHLIKY